jgi:hypothetical protein
MTEGPGWEEHRAYLLQVTDEPEKEEVAPLLEQAATAARRQDLREAARVLEEAHQVWVRVHLFAKWPRAIDAFCDGLRRLREMAPGTPVPREYQRLLDAIPTTLARQNMTPSQRMFWFGSRSPSPLDPPEPEPWQMWLGAVVVVAVLAYFLLR